MLFNKSCKYLISPWIIQVHIHMYIKIDISIYIQIVTVHAIRPYDVRDSLLILPRTVHSRSGATFRFWEDVRPFFGQRCVEKMDVRPLFVMSDQRLHYFVMFFLKNDYNLLKKCCIDFWLVATLSFFATTKFGSSFSRFLLLLPHVCSSLTLLLKQLLISPTFLHKFPI